MADSLPVSDTSVELSRFTSRKGSRLADSLITDGDLSDLVNSFDTALSDIRKGNETNVVIDAFGRMLWQYAIDFAHGERNHRRLPGTDDRPLYWARLAMRQSLRQWRPRFRVDADRLTDWTRRLEWSSRGITSTSFSEEDDAIKVLISGFDPFGLQHHPSSSNPSGAAVLRLHDTTVETDAGPVRFRGVILPVRYADFDNGLVEKIFRPHLIDGDQQVDLAVTISQGRPDSFDLEVYNGRGRYSGTTRDNDGVAGGTDQLAPAQPGELDPGPEFTRSTLPMAAMMAADGKPFTVRVNPQTSRLLPGRDYLTTNHEPPEPTAIAVKGSGGGFLSNEVAYRVTRLRDELGVSVPCGHIHTPSLEAPMDVKSTTLDPDTVAAQRVDIVDQTRELLLLAVTNRQSDHQLKTAAGPHTGWTAQWWFGASRPRHFGCGPTDPPARPDRSPAPSTGSNPPPRPSDTTRSAEATPTAPARRRERPDRSV